ncbi:hypothetical protein G5I_07540 [Acromyrmex echinatior]|uniref:Uncharacterized protein n=1 Tax=Acromyrmex echinatior TaxID=103372 RepID=F4WP30_ACREC|nr:hypothetical protein G5I_07540 [Acromyrmex echinatior]
MRPKLGRSVYNLQTRERALPHRSGLPQLQCAPFSEAESSHRVVLQTDHGAHYSCSVPSGDAAVQFVAAKGDGRPSCFLNVTEFVPSASGEVHVVRNIRECRDTKLQLTPFTLFPEEALYSANEPTRRQALGSQVLEGSRGSLLATSPGHSSSKLPALPLSQLTCSGRTPRVGGEEKKKANERLARGEGKKERKKELPLGGYSRVSSSPRSVINTVAVRLRRQWVESSRAIRSPSSSGIPRGAESKGAGQAPPRGKPVCMDDVPILTDAKG